MSSIDNCGKADGKSFQVLQHNSVWAPALTEIIQAQVQISHKKNRRCQAGPEHGPGLGIQRRRARVVNGSRPKAHIAYVLPSSKNLVTPKGLNPWGITGNLYSHQAPLFHAMWYRTASISNPHRIISHSILNDFCSFLLWMKRRL